MPGWITRGQVRAQPFARYDETGLQDMLEAFDSRMRRLNDQYLRMMGEHIADIGALWPSDVHRLQQIRRMNRALRQIEAQIGRAVDMSADEVEDVFTQLARQDARMAQKILGKPDVLRVSDNLPLQRILRAQARETAGAMRNLANTSVVSTWYRKAVDEAVTAAQSGVEDYGSAIRRVIREAGQAGLRVTGEGVTKADYESGYSRRLDTAARMNVLDGVRHLNQSVMEEIGRQLGADGVEIDAHMLCAEDHLPYQGGQYSNEEFEEIQDSLPRPFGEWNCRHSWHPIMLGISPPTYTPERLEEFRAFSTEPVTIDGRTKTRYEWSQEMRRCEVAIRQQKDTATLAKAAGDDRLRARCQETIGALNRHYGQLAAGAGLKAEHQRTYVAGFRDAKGAGTLTSLRIINDADGNVVFSHAETPEIQNAKSFDLIAEYFHYEDKTGHLCPVLNDNMAEADLLIVKEIAEGIKWAKDTYGLSDVMPKTIKLGILDGKAIGEYNRVTREITLREDISVEEAYITVIHEMTHFADDHFGQASKRLVDEALRSLGVEPGSDSALAYQYGLVKERIEVYRDPMELLAYSVEYSLTGANNRLGTRIAELWFERVKKK